MSEEFLLGRCLSFESFSSCTVNGKRAGRMMNNRKDGVISGPGWHTTVQDWPAWPMLNNAWQRNAHLYSLQHRPINILSSLLESSLSPVRLRAASSTFTEADERHHQRLLLVFVRHVFLDSLSPCGPHWPTYKNCLLNVGRIPHSSRVCIWDY